MDAKIKKNRVRELRDKAGVSQRKMAADLGLAYRTIQYIEQGQTVPSMDTAIAISDYFGVSVDKIFNQKT